MAEHSSGIEFDRPVERILAPLAPAIDVWWHWTGFAPDPSCRRLGAVLVDPLGYSSYENGRTAMFF